MTIRQWICIIFQMAWPSLWSQHPAKFITCIKEIKKHNGCGKVSLALIIKRLREHPPKSTMCNRTVSWRSWSVWCHTTNTEPHENRHGWRKNEAVDEQIHPKNRSVWGRAQVRDKLFTYLFTVFSLSWPAPSYKFHWGSRAGSDRKLSQISEEDKV